MSTTSPQGHVIRNAVVTAYYSLKAMGRFMDGSHVSPYKDFFEKILNRKLDGELPNTEVESFYLNKVKEKDFVNTSECRIGPALVGDGDIITRLLNTVWIMELATPAKSTSCDGNLSEPSRQLWEIFIRLDTDCVGAAHIEDVCDLIMRIFRATGHEESPEIIQEWFNNQMTVNFWIFYEVMATNYTKCLMNPVVGEIYHMVSTETIKEGRLTKKGHIVPNWKGRWFTLTVSSLAYREAKDQPVLKTIVVNDKTQVQNMPEAKGQKWRFRVLDGSSNTPTEISAADEFTMREWTAFLKLAIKMHQVEGRNFLHKYRLAINTFPKSFFSQSSAVPMFTAAPSLPQVRTKVTTDPTHRALKYTQSVPVSPDDNTYSSDGIYELPPPIPPQKFDTPPETREELAPPRVQGNSANRRRSSLDSSEIEHIRVDCDLEYAVVTKVNVKKKAKSSTASAPGDRTSSPGSKRPSSTSPLPSPQTPPPQPPPHRRSPKLADKSSSVETSPSTGRGYAELAFDNGKLSDTQSNLPPNVPNKFAYSKLQFDEETDSKPTPPPRYHGNMGKHLTESNIQNPHSNGMPQEKPTSLPELNPNKVAPDLDYAEVVFSNSPSPAVTPRILSMPDEQGKSPKPGGTAPRVEYATVILTGGGRAEVQEEREDKKERPDGYENFDFNQVLANQANLKNGPKVCGNARLVTQEELVRPQPKPRASPRKVPPTGPPPHPPARYNH